MADGVVRPPGPGGGWFSGALQGFRKAPLDYLRRMEAEYGHLVYFQAGHQHMYFVNDPELVRDVLVTRNHVFTKSRILQRAKSLLGNGLLTNEGAPHRKQRRLVQPAFYRDRLARYGEEMATLADRARDRWADGETLDIDREMMRLTLAIVGRTLFSADVEQEAPQVGEAMNALIAMMPLLMLPGSQFIEWVPLPATRRYLRACRLLDALIYRIIAERRASGIDTGDLLSTLLLARDTEEDGAGMDDKQARDEALTLFLAGHETTATGLAWTWHLLAQHPEVEARMHAEIDRITGGRRPGYEALGELRYTQQVFAEALRLYPPAWALGRMAQEEIELGGYRLPRKSIVLLSPALMHRRAEFWPEPDRFDPDRWANGEFQRRDFTYFPFGGGPRVCAGERFAWMEAVLILAVIGQRWRFRMADDRPVEPQAMITLRPRGGVRVVATSR